MDEKQVSNSFKAMMNSCVEGHTRSRNPVGEGANRFIDMYEQLSALAAHFGVDIIGVREIHSPYDCIPENCSAITCAGCSLVGEGKG